MSKVSDFIDPNTSYWDEDLVRQTLWPIDAQRVLAIPLPIHEMLDFVTWSFTKNGLFTVRSAYWEEWNKQYGRKLQYTNGMGRSDANPVWSKIWKLSCSGKVKIFIWHILHGTLPCRVMLANRHVMVPPIYPTCSNGLEDTKHLVSVSEGERGLG